ncbi:DOMON-like domain-containing protein [Novosphingobium sp.]|uniref:DOMON-like domain-containing protein n=1 Tax=Novosphingobium sp. TaxID=1874826 RepID=UPI0025F2F242|nr:DOMON-like domain-containing protein [Novosphingobium sp.]MCC6924289.1 DOMON-like domain-containing protein [Novosphingobium sp.]
MEKVLGKFGFVPHPDFQHPDLMIGCKVSTSGAETLKFEYVVIGDIEQLAIPGPAPRQRTDGLWQHTCMEAFIMVGDGSYLELNFSPSGQWATYRFSDYREGMAEASDIALKPLAMGWQKSSMRFWLAAEVEVPELVPTNECRLGLAAVIEETDGSKSYWALAHPPGKPDFHHPACFAATLPAPL